MINPKELRIGNWVDVGEIETLQFQIESISRDGVNRTETYGYPDEPGGIGPYVDFISFDSIKPIPLAPEILEKCGFTDKWGDGTFIGDIRGHRWVKWLNEDGESFEIRHEDEGYGLLGSEPYWIIGKPFQHLHQLQNLYFALTGQELEINL